ncbi:hypothetical protein DFJ63DRAFT_236704 [Scheffersomyces coipomensis]|uniref:uncharacterized protein n=1 Tax=Scheffersomyces coipomensis TaxID=1788519 RepID=UPI00315C5FBA
MLRRSMIVKDLARVSRLRGLMSIPQPRHYSQPSKAVNQQINLQHYENLNQSTSSFQAKYDNIQDYGSYKHNVFTHRLPESTASQSPPLVALHSRLNLSSQYSLSTLSQALNLNKFDDGLANNYGLNILGKNLLSYYVSEYLLVKYPRLPMPIHNVAVDSLMGSKALYQIGKIWGIEVDKSSKLDKYLSQESEFLKYGKLRYLTEERLDNNEAESGVYELSSEEITNLKSNNNTASSSSFISDEVEAYGSAVRAIIGGLYTHQGEEITKQFIQDHILSRKLLLENMFEFSQPTRELVRLCDKLNFQDPIDIRLIAETGRLSSHAIYVVGVFCGVEKLGEGVGSSMNEAKTRAVVNALMSYYLYSPIDNEGNEVKVPSDKDYKYLDGIVGLGDVAI